MVRQVLACESPEQEDRRFKPRQTSSAPRIRAFVMDARSVNGAYGE